MENKKAPHNESIEQEKQSKYTSFHSEKEMLCSFLSKNTATASMAAHALKITQKNITRYKAMLEEDGRLMVLFKAKCRRTNRKADYLTTDPLLLSKLNNRTNECS